jgi:single-stranded-DNA-specific exonuclease
VIYHIPNRFRDGYGPNLERYQEYVAAGVKLVITVDNGVSGFEQIEYLNSNKVDVILTDHHEMPAVLPEAYAIIHTHNSPDYPDKTLAGVGVAFKLAWALLGEMPVEFLDLLTIGTIADMVELTDENRLFVKYGLDYLKNTERVGLQKLYEVAGINMGKFDGTTVGFQIAPRINSIGRLCGDEREAHLKDVDPKFAVELMMTDDEAWAKDRAEFVNQLNTDRKALVDKAVVEAEELTNPNEPIIVVAKEGWHEGICGLVASSLMNKYVKPAIVLSIGDGFAKGSARSIEGLNLYEALTANKEVFEGYGFGGHAAAAGMSLAVDRIDELRAGLINYIKENEIDLSRGIPKEVLALKIEDITVDLIESFDVLKPFGMGNPEFDVLVENVGVTNAKTLKDKHLKFAAFDQPTNKAKLLDCIAWSSAEYLSEFSTGFDQSIVGSLQINEWNNHKNPQLIISDFAINGNQVFDYRGKARLSDFLKLNLVNALYLSESGKFAKHLPSGAIVYTDDLTGDFSELVIWDIPHDLKKVGEIIHKFDIDRIYLVCLNDEIYLTGMPSREQLNKVYKFLAEYKKIPKTAKRINDFARYLRINPRIVTNILEILRELGAVEFTDEEIKFVGAPTSGDFAQTEAFRSREAFMKNEELLAYAPMDEVKEVLKDGF